MANKLNNVLYLAIIRVDGQCIVASFGQAQWEGTVSQVVNAPAFRSKVGTGQRIRKQTPPFLQTILCHWYQLAPSTSPLLLLLLLLLLHLLSSH